MVNRYVVNNLYWLVAGNGMLAVNFLVYNRPVPAVTCFGWIAIIWSVTCFVWYLKTRKFFESRPRTVGKYCFVLFVIFCIPIIEYVLVGQVDHLIQVVTLVLLIYELIQIYFLCLNK